MTHQHNFIARDDDDGWLYEDGAVHIIAECDHAEVTSAKHSEKHDETFYGYGAECEASRTYRFDLTTIEAVHRTDGTEVTGTLTESFSEVIELYDQCSSFVEEIEEAACERLTEGAIVDFLDREQVDESDHMIEIKYDGQPFYLTYELDTVSEDY